jgi:molecular chaperone GrpE
MPPAADKTSRAFLALARFFHAVCLIMRLKFTKSSLSYSHCQICSMGAPMQYDQNMQAQNAPFEPARQTESTTAQNMAQAATTPGMDEQLARAEASLAETQDAFLRARAETENVRRRAREDIATAHKFATENFAEALLPVKDSLEIALQIETPSVESLKEGVSMTLRQLSSAFEKNSVIEINPGPGEKFDPGKHQAVAMVTAEQNPNTIVSVLQKGYLIADRLLRPALVTVAQQKAE